MSELLTLREAGIPYPDISLLERVANRLGRQQGTATGFNGGWLRDLVHLGHTSHTQDLDTTMSIADFLGLKPHDKAMEDIRKHFVLHEPHLLFMLHQLQDDALGKNPRPAVLTLKREFMASWGLEIPLGLNLSRNPFQLPDLIADVDLGFTGIVSDGTEIWVTPAFIEDRRNRTITLRCCRDARDYERSIRRIDGFLSHRYAGWISVVPEEFQHFATAE